MSKKILLLSPPGWSPVRAYRGEGVMLHLPKLDPEIELVFPRHDEPWKDVMACDMVYCFRTFEERYRRVAQLAKEMRKPLWFDLDDDLFNIRRSHPNYAGLTGNEVQTSLRWMLRFSDIVTVSTQELANRVIQEGFQSSTVIPNALDNYTLDFNDTPIPENRTLHWRGGASHMEDLLAYQDEMLGIDAQLEGSFHFHGYDPWFLELPSSQCHPYIPDYFQYMRDLRSRKPWAVVVPLMDTPFNRCKSNIAALEAIWAGAIPIAPDWDEWKTTDGPIFSYNPGSYTSLTGKALGVMMSLETEDYVKVLGGYRQWLKENRLLSVVNKKRLEIVNLLANDAF